MTPAKLDDHLAGGWRHFGRYFFRYNFGFFHRDVRAVLPLRIKIDDFRLSKSQKRVLRKNTDTEMTIAPPEFGSTKHAMFKKHAKRFTFGQPDSIYTFLGHEGFITDVREFSVFLEGELVATSYIDVGENSTSSIYAMFEPDHAKRSLGIYTMLKEIEFARDLGKEFIYQGYAYLGESFYDYKKQFSGTQYYDWFGEWHPYSIDLE